MADPKAARHQLVARRMFGGCLGLVCFLSIMCCFVPSLVFRYEYGSDPLAKEKFDTSLETINEGMTADAVRQVLGEPHVVYPDSDGAFSWLYWTDSLRIGYLGVRFGKDGRVISQWH